jgi:hypothetical protein
MSIIPAHWYYNTESGQLTRGNNIDNLVNNLFGGLGWHELNIPGSDTGIQAAAAARAEFPHGATPDYSPVTAKKVADQAANEAGVPVTGINAIGDFFANLGKRAEWVRIAEVIIGVALVIVAVDKLTGGAIGKATNGKMLIV